MIKLITVIAILFAGCCAATKPTKAQNPAPVEPAAVEAKTAVEDPVEHLGKIHQKPDPRLKVELTTERDRGTTVARLRVRATGVCTGVKARIVVPQEVSIVEGDKEVDFGPLKAGDERIHTVRLNIPAEAQFTLAGGADCTINPAVTLNASAVLPIGVAQDSEPKTEVIRPKGNGPGLRLAPAKSE